MIDSQDEQINLTHSKKLGTLQFDFYCKSQPQLCNLVFSIQNLLKDTPQFYYHSILMINQGRPIDSIQRRLKKDLQSLTQGKNFYQIIQRAMDARQKCLQKLHTSITHSSRVLKLFKKHYLNPKNNNSHMSYIQYVQKQGYSTIKVQQTIENAIQLIQKIFIDMSRLRDMTIYIVEMVHQWRVKMEEWMDKCGQWRHVGFWYHGEDVYEKILRDTQFIWQSAFNEYIFISSTNDPFIIRNLIKVNQRQQKTILEKYFLQLLYPRSQSTIQKCIKCQQMLTYKYEKKVNQLNRQEELLIQNYLQMRKRQLQQEGIQEIDRTQVQWQTDRKRESQLNKIYSNKGWIFGNRLKKPIHERVQQLVDRHHHKVTFIKPAVGGNNVSHNLTTKAQRNKITSNLQQLKLGFNTQIGRFSSNDKKDNQKQGRQTNVRVKSMSNGLMKRSSSQNKNAMSNGEQLQPITHRQSLVMKKKENNLPLRMYQSLTKLSHPNTIFQDPHQHNIQTPKHNKTKQIKAKINQSLFIQQDSSRVKEDQISRNENILAQGIEQSHDILTIKLQQQTAKNKSEQKQQKQLQTNQSRLSAVRQLITIYNNKPSITPITNMKSTQANIKKPTILLNQIKPNNITKASTERFMNKRSTISGLKSINHSESQSKKKINKSKSIQLKDQKSHLITTNKLVQSQTKVSKQLKTNHSVINLPTDKILLKPKSIPFDVVPTYMLHLFNRLNPTSKKFTLYNLQQLTTKLSNPLLHSIMFDISSDKRGPIGQVILSQHYNHTENKLTYQIQFINISVFELFLSTVIKVVEELLMMTPCEEVRMIIYEDKLDAVSVHFVELIEQTLSQHVLLNGRYQFTVTQMRSVKYNNHKQQVEVTQKLLTFINTNKNASISQQHKLTKQLMLSSNSNSNNKNSNNNYRSLKFQCKCLILASNFKMRSKNQIKDVINNYDKVSLGYLYLRVLMQILNKRHLGQIKSMLSNSNSSINMSNGFTNNNQQPTINPNQQLTTIYKKLHNNNNQSSNNTNTLSFIRTSVILLKQYLQKLAIIDNAENQKGNMIKSNKIMNNSNNNNNKKTINENLISQQIIQLTKFTHMPQLLNYLQYKKHSQHFNFNFLQQSIFYLNHQLYLSQLQLQFSLQFQIQQSANLLILNNHMGYNIKYVQEKQSKGNTIMKSVILPTTQADIQIMFIDGTQYTMAQNTQDLFTYMYHYQQQNHTNNHNHNNQSSKQTSTSTSTTSIIKQITIPKINHNQQHSNNTNIKMFQGLFRLFPQRQFHSATYFKTYNLWQGYYQPAVVYQPQNCAIVFQYPFIVGVISKKTGEVITAFLLKDDNNQ